MSKETNRLEEFLNSQPKDANENVQIMFKFYSNIFGSDRFETLWAIPVDEAKGIYKIDSIPFFVPMAAPEDLIYAEFDLIDGMLLYKETVEYSGNSTVQIVLLDGETEVDTLQKKFEELGALSDKLNENYFAMMIPAEVDYAPIKKLLLDLEKLEIISYAEPCLSEGHS